MGFDLSTVAGILWIFALAAAHRPGKLGRILGWEVWWPTSNTQQHFSTVDKNQFLESREFGRAYGVVSVISSGASASSIHRRKRS
jgi:hypothetical protein